MKRALIVIDVQNDYFDGALAIAYPDRALSLANTLLSSTAHGSRFNLGMWLGSISRGSAGSVARPNSTRAELVTTLSRSSAAGPRMPW